MSNPNASIIYVNAVYSAVDTDDLGLIEAISERLTIKDYEHRPSKFSKWDGTKRLFDRKTRLFPNGYLREVLEECKYYGAVEVDQMLKDRVRPVSREEIYNWIEKKTIVNDRGETIEPFDYQKESVYLFTKFSASKSLKLSIIHFLKFSLSFLSITKKCFALTFIGILNFSTRSTNVCFLIIARLLFSKCSIK